MRETFEIFVTLQTLDNLSIEIQAGTTVAIVGPSGSGKSTTIQLIQRFYDTISGEVSWKLELPFPIYPSTDTRSTKFAVRNVSGPNTELVCRKS